MPCNTTTRALFAALLLCLLAACGGGDYEDEMVEPDAKPGTQPVDCKKQPKKCA